MDKIKVLIIDDSALVRQLLTKILESDPRIDVVGTAPDPLIARDKIKLLSPDVLTLDIEMPKMDGIAFLKNLMRLRPMPVVMISTLTENGAPATLEALSLGAVDYLPKPKMETGESLEDYKKDIIEKIIVAAGARVSSLESLSTRKPKASVAADMPKGRLRPNFVSVIGASTGGTEAIKEVLKTIPANSPPILIAQHIPEAFSTSYAKRLDDNCIIKVFEAFDGQKIEAGCAYLAPGDDHLLIKRGAKPGEFLCRLLKSDPVNRHRPSVDVLFDSVAEHFGKNCVASLLTGMGADGAQGLLNLKNVGAETIAQDEETSVVWGMPGAAVKLNAANKVLPLDKIAMHIMKTSTMAGS
jgi:two-component system chemotaxis response regulator CheB